MENDDESATQDGPGNPMVIDCTETVIGGSKLDKGKAKIEYDAETGENLTKDATPGPDSSSNLDSSLHDDNEDGDLIGDDDDFDDDDPYTSDYGSDEYMSEEDDSYSAMQAKFFDNVDLPSGVEAAVPWLMKLNSTPKSSASVSETNKKVTETVPVESKIKEASTGSLTTVSADSSSSGAKENENTEVVVRQVKDFKQFDTVEDFSDHHYSHMGFKEGAPPKEWAKKIQAEWKILEKNLPDTIFVRVSESRMELLRAVIMGPDGTPYHDGLFVFDCFFPPNYPAGPPTVYYYSGGLRLNPNLYDCGKVCLSLLGTWPGRSSTETWNPQQSTMLQVLVSIQALILNAEPYFNEPGYESSYASKEGKRKSELYSEDTFIFSLKTMMYTIRRPPRYFEDLVAAHFYSRARDILLACKAYTEGALVGSIVVKDGVVTTSGNQKITKSKEDFKAKVGKLMNVLATNFIKNGSTDLDEFGPA